MVGIKSYLIFCFNINYLFFKYLIKSIANAAKIIKPLTTNCKLVSILKKAREYNKPVKITTPNTVPPFLPILQRMIYHQLHKLE